MYIAACRKLERLNVAVGIYNHGVALSSGSVKDHMVDILLVGKDDVMVKAAYFILTCYSSVLDDVFSKWWGVHIATNLMTRLGYSWL